ncbi:MAG: DinB family protein [Acidobacteriia bacterium]|nr:DinB family protein [Terriglobia bacterium]
MKMKWLFAFLFMFACSVIAWGQTPASTEHRSVSQVLDRGVAGVEQEFVPAADAMPEDKYSFAPTSGEFKGVRTFAQQIKHVAAVNYIFGAAILQEKAPVDLGGENGPDPIRTKADILKFLKDSFAYAHKAVASIDEKTLTDPIKSPFGEGSTTRLGMATAIPAHCFDHYGQMVEYLRMNGLIPPASR